jgi:hypothetical protein
LKSAKNRSKFLLTQSKEKDCSAAVRLFDKIGLEKFGGAKILLGGFRNAFRNTFLEDLFF